MAYDDEKEEIEREIIKESEDFRLFSSELGRIMFSSPVLREETESLRTRLDDIRKRRKEEEKKLSIMKETVSSYEERKARKEALEGLIEKSKAESKELSVRLGAAIYEQCSFSIPDKTVFAIVYSDLAEDNRLEESSSSPFMRILNHGKAALRKMGRDSRYASYASIALSSSAELVRKMGRDSRYASYASIALSSSAELEGNAFALKGQIEDIKKEEAEMAAERDALLASLESDSDSYREMVRTSIAESTSVIEKLGKSEEEAEAEIGRFFFDRGGDWIDETTPQEALDSVEKMLLSANRTEELRKNLDKLERSAKRDEYNALIESEEGKIKVLEEDKARLDAEIEEMKAEIARLRREIDKLGGDDDL